MVIAVTGANGRLGSHLVKLGCVPIEIDIADRQAVADCVDVIRPQVIINCAAYTKVDEAEAQREEALHSNFYGPSVLRRAFDGLLIHLSTGYIFDGKEGPYSEGAEPSPISNYGWSKLGGEHVAQMRDPTLIVRTLDLFGRETVDFVRQVRDIVDLGREMELPNHLYGNPTYIPHLAEALIECGQRGLTGIINYAGSEVLSRAEWGKIIAEKVGGDPDLIVGSKTIKGLAPRPLRGGLIVEKAINLGLKVYSPLDALTQLLVWEQDHDG